MATIKHIDRWDVVTDDNFVLYRAKTEQEAKDYLEGWYEKTYLGQDYFGNKLYIGDKVRNVELVGLCTDICVVSNALIIKSTFPDAQVKVDSACCAGVTPESHEAALKTMQMCQVEVV